MDATFAHVLSLLRVQVDPCVECFATRASKRIATGATFVSVKRTDLNESNAAMLDVECTVNMGSKGTKMGVKSVDATTPRIDVDRDPCVTCTVRMGSRKTRMGAIHVGVYNPPSLIDVH
jgi:hypothetical protein